MTGDWVTSFKTPPPEQPSSQATERYASLSKVRRLKNPSWSLCSSGVGHIKIAHSESGICGCGRRGLSVPRLRTTATARYHA